VLNNILLTRFLQSFTLCYIILWKILIVVIIHEYGREDPNRPKALLEFSKIPERICIYVILLVIIRSIWHAERVCIKFYEQEFHAPYAAPNCNTSTFNSNGGNGVE